MRRSQVAAVLARRLNVAPGRVQAITERLAGAGLVSRARGSRRFPHDLADNEIVAMILSCFADRGLGDVLGSVQTFGALESDNGQSLAALLTGLLTGGADLASVVTGSLIVRHDPPGASLTAAGVHLQFGQPPPEGAAGKATIVPGRTLAAICLELQGRPESEADALVALARLSNTLSLSNAFERPMP